MNRVAVTLRQLATMTGSRVAVSAFVAWTLVANLPLFSATTAPQDTASLSVVLEKATAYVTGYIKALSSIVTEERYEQRVTRQVPRGTAPPEKQVTSRILVSDFLLVQAPGATDWMPFRDVYSVDGVPVRDRSDRLFGLKPATQVDSLRQEIKDVVDRFATDWLAAHPKR